MELFKLINSNAVRNHLKEINYEFTTDEAAFVVWTDYNKTIMEKHQAWEWIIQNMKDVNIRDKFERIYYGEGLDDPKYYTLHNCLKKYMELENKVIEAAMKTERNTVFSFETYYHEDSSECEDGRLFTTCEDVLSAIENEKKKHEKRDMQEYPLECIYLKKQWLDNEKEKMILLRLLPDGEVFDIYKDINIYQEFDGSDIRYMFDEMWFDIPTPFKKGDILYTKAAIGDYPVFEEPFVLEYICYWGKDNIEDARKRHAWGSMDMTAYGYFPYDDGTVYYECMHSYLSLDYYEGELENNLRTLKAISNYMKDKIDLSLLLDAHTVIVNEERNKKHLKQINAIDEGLRLKGLKD